MSTLSTKERVQKSYTSLIGLLLIIATTSIGFLIAFTVSKSESDSQVYLGLSLTRLGILAFILIISILGLIGLVSVWRDKETTLDKIYRFFKRERSVFDIKLIFCSLFVGQLVLLNFEADSFGLLSEHFLQIRLIIMWGALICGLTATYLFLFDPLTKLSISYKSLVFALLGAGLIIIWKLTSQSMVGRPATTWMGYFQVESYSNANIGTIAQFIKEMRAGIPPLISISEIINSRITGSTLLITREFYRLALLTAYLIAAFLFANNLLKGIFSATIAGVFMSATILISARNPEIYDIYYPCFLLLFFLFLQITQNWSQNKFLWAFLAGFFLALAELSRPFVLLLLPFFLIFGILSLRKLPRKVLIAFLLPILVISGGWHLKLLIFNNGQIFWSNHSGYNLYRAWEEVAEIPDPPEEPQTWDNRNQIHSQDHYRNSQEIQKAVFEFIVKNPGESISYMFERLLEFLQPRTSFFDEPELGGILINAYRFIFTVCLVFWVIQLLVFGFNLFRKPWGFLFSDPQNILLITTTITIFLLAVSEKGEEARLLLAVLPMIAALPTYQNPQKANP